MDKVANLNSSWPLAFNTQWLKENLPRYLWRENEIPRAIVQVNILYIGESSQRVAVLYQVELRRLDSEVRWQMYVGYLVPGDRFAAEHETMLKKAKIQPPFGRAVALIPEAEMILVAFPNDRKLHLLTEADLQPWLETHLHEVANGAREDKRWQLQETKTEILRYVPDKRCTTRCRARIKSENGLEKEISFIAKQLNDGEKAKRQYRNLLSLRRAWAGNGVVPHVSSTSPQNEIKLPVRLPRALALDEKKATVFIEEIPGKNLEHALAEIDLAQVMPAAGEMLANFHRAQKRVKKRVSLKSELAEVRGVIRTLVKIFPALQPRLQQLYKLLRTLPGENDTPAVLLHGTFRLNHIFIHGRELALVDFDSLCMGPPAYDIANFLSSLYYLEAQERLSPSLRQQSARYFIEGYAAQAPLAVPPEVVLWFLTGLLIEKQAYKFVKHFHEDRAQKVERILELAAATLARYQHAPNDLTLATLWKVLP